MKTKFTPMSKWISIEKADGLRLCKKCNFAGRFEKQSKPCDYHRHGESLNFRGVPSGMCALRPEDRDRVVSDYGIDTERKIL